MPETFSPRKIPDKNGKVEAAKGPKPRTSSLYSQISISRDESQFKQLFVDWITYCKSEGLSGETVYAHSDRVSKFYWWFTHEVKPVDTHPRYVTTAITRQYAVYLREPQKKRWGVANSKERLSIETVKDYWQTAKVFFNWLVRESHIEKSPFAGEKLKFSSKQKDTTIKNIAPEALARIFTVLTEPERVKTFAGCRDLALISLLLDSGIRRGELLSMQISDVDFSRLRCTVNGKTGQRIAHFSEKCKGPLMDYLRLRKDISNSGPLWYGREGEPLSTYGFNSLMVRLNKLTGVDFNAHQFRHTFALMMSSKVDPFTLRDLLGHTSLDTTSIYVRANPDRLGELHRPVSPLNTLEDNLPGLKRPGRPRKYR